MDNKYIYIESFLFSLRKNYYAPIGRLLRLLVKIIIMKKRIIHKLFINHCRLAQTKYGLCGQLVQSWLKKKDYSIYAEERETKIAKT